MQITATRPSPARRSTASSVLAAAIFATATVAVAGIGSIAMRGGQDWYDTLDKPSFTPPGATFGIMWTILYVAIAVAGWLAWRATHDRRPTVTWAAQMALNLIWTAVFFGLEAPSAGLAVIALLIGSVAINVRESRHVDTVAGALLFPYQVWCLFAAALNIGVVVLN